MSEAGHILAIASGKGGVGKTVIAIGLAHAAARAGKRVLLFDGDLGLANVDIQLGLAPRQDLSDVIAGRCGLQAAIMHHAAGGFDILPGSSGSGALAALDAKALEAMLAALHEAGNGYDALLLDLGAGLQRAVRRMAAWADRLAVVVTEDPTSLTDAYAVLKLYAADRGLAALAAAQVVVNLASGQSAGTRVFTTLERACHQFLGQSPRLGGLVHRDDRVRDAVRRQTLLAIRHPTSAAATDLAALVPALLE